MPHSLRSRLLRFETLEARITPATLTVTSLTDVVDSSDDPVVLTLREAVQLANASPADDIITFAPELTEAGPATILLTNGELAITDIEGVTTIEGPGASLLHIDGNETSRIFNVAAATEVLISGLDLQNARTAGEGAASFGGAIRNEGDLTLAEVHIHHSSAEHGGGGIASSLGALTLIDCNIYDNIAKAGGGIQNDADATIIRSTISNNVASRGQEISSGGGITNFGSLTIDDSTVSLNRADNGAGIVAIEGTVRVTNSLITANMAQLDGGGIERWSGSLVIESSTLSANSAGEFGGAVYGQATIRNSLLVGNTAQDGAGIYADGNTSISNSTITGNLALYDGAGIYNDGTTLLLNVTLVNNWADSNSDTIGSGGGIFNWGQVTLRNTIVAGNTRGQDNTASDFEGKPATFADYNLVGDPATAGGLEDGETGNIVGMDDGGERILLPLADIIDLILSDNGGPTLTFALLADSPAVDAGSNLAVQQANILWDQRGQPFPRIVAGPNLGAGPTVDIGAFELAKAPTLVSLEASTSSAVVGQDVTFTATITSPISGDLTGSVTFNVDGVDMEPVALTLDGEASFTINTLSAGLHFISATFSGDDTFAVSTGMTSVEITSAQSMALSGGHKLLQNQLGAIIGDLSVPNPPLGATYTFSVTDVRFEVVGSQLQLKSNEAILTTGTTIGLEVTATDQNENAFTEHFELTIEANAHPWHKTAMAEDANSDNVRDIKDAIFIIRFLRRNLGGELDIPRPTAANGGHYGDVTANNILDITDAIAVIRFLRRQAAGGEGEAADYESASQPTSDASSPAWDVALMMFPEGAAKKKTSDLAVL